MEETIIILYSDIFSFIFFQNNIKTNINKNVECFLSIRNEII